jgi:hypothetical protein
MNSGRRIFPFEGLSLLSSAYMDMRLGFSILAILAVMAILAISDSIRAYN